MKSVDVDATNGFSTESYKWSVVGASTLNRYECLLRIVYIGNPQDCHLLKEKINIKQDMMFMLH